MRRRTYEIIALNLWAKNFVHDAKREESDEYVMAGSADISLFKYKKPDGTEFLECEQTSFSRHGETIFLALKTPQGRTVPESLWSDQEVESYRNMQKTD
ncbi:MAG: hypothetical protein HY514_04285 [Candidatus Aenigmarchaeota archaeon]|nr:hypothetical protein [Candidatus Aenigmarchaeota archaeon]